MKVRGVVFLGLLLCFLFIELSTATFRIGKTCGKANTNPCGWRETYIQSMNICVKKYSHSLISLFKAQKVCALQDKGFLLEPNTKERIEAVAAFASRYGLTRLWVGLFFNRKARKFTWLRYGNPLTKKMYEQFGVSLRKDQCVELHRMRRKATLVPQRCGVFHAFFCGVTSAFMPRRPKITVHYKNWASDEFEGGTELNVSCEAVLSEKGDLKVVIFSKTETKFYVNGDTNVEYAETLGMDTDGLCKRYGVLHVKLKMSLNMDGKTLACISYIDEAFQMCSEYDQYCDIAGTLRVLPGPPGELCQTAVNEPCSVPEFNYIDELNSCLYHYEDYELPWRLAIDTCHDDQGILVEPNTEKRSLAVAKYARQHNIDRYWIGLSFDRNYTNDFIWSQYGNVLTKEMHTRFENVSKRGTCVAAILGDNITWVQEDCQRDFYFFCDAESELMPRKPTISKDRFDNYTSELLLEGTELHVTCEGVLSQKGYLRIALFSHVELFGFNDSGVIYSEDLRFDEDLLCKRHGAINVTLRVSLDMDGKTLACVSFTDEAFEMCSTADRYCDVAGVLRVYSVPKVPGPEVSVFPWWIVLLLLLFMSASMMITPMMVKRIHHGEEEARKSDPKDPAKEAGTGGPAL